MMMDFAERRWTSRDGLALYARDYAARDGEARLPVMCLHGLTRNSKDFEDIAPLIAGWGRRVIVPDVRGRGQSAHDPKPANYNPKTYARDVLGLMDLLGIPRAVFLGTSMGGLITMTVAAIRSKVVAAAILNDVGPAIAPEGVARILNYAGKGAPIASWDDATEYLRSTSGIAFPAFDDDDWRRLAKRTFRDSNGRPELDYDPAIAAPLRAPGRLVELVAWLLFRRLARRRPTLLIRGGLSDIVSADIAARMHKAAPAMQEVVVPQVGHAPMLDEPVAVDAIAQFLRTVP
jgi:pimeloyl-ACP methyl ester carboxylesterase